VSPWPLHRRLAAKRCVKLGAKARFIDPTLLLRTDALPDDPEQWIYQLKLDGYRAAAYRNDREPHLRSRNDNDFTRRYARVAKALAKLRDQTVIDGEIVALDEDCSENPATRGREGLTGPLHKDSVLDMVMKHFDDVYQLLNIQMRRMAQMQQQVDLLDSKVNDLIRKSE
jgi:bifunctional non-homologous end joining protein LigD